MAREPDRDALSPDALPFSTAFAAQHPFGYLVGVNLPAAKEPVDAAVLERLDCREAARARALRGFRQIEWVGGRLSGHVAARHFGASGWWLGVGGDGEPVPPPGYSASVSHKRALAVALVVDASDAGLGVDLEGDVIAARRIADVVLSEDERATLDALSADERDRAYVIAFALKEAAYKALWPALRRPLGYRDAVVTVLPGGAASIEMRLTEVARQPELEAACEWRQGQVIAAVRVRRSRP